MKSKDLIILAIVLLSVLAIALTVGFVFLLRGNYNIINLRFDFSDSSMELINSKEVQSSLINNIDVKLFSTDVELKKSENENIRVELYSNNDNNLRIEVTEDVVKIEETENREVRIGFNNRKKAIIYVPENYLGEFNLVTTSSDINSEIDLVSNKINIVTTSGDIELNNIGESNIVATSGDVWIGKASKTIDIKSTSGDIDIEELDLKENSKIETTSGDININNNTCNCYIEVETTSGDEYINKYDRKSEIELKIKTISGDISVN